MPGPGRPPNEKDLLQFMNGSPVYLGTIVSAGAATNNATTATPFSHQALGASDSVASPANYTNTLAGKTLLLQTSAAGLILPSAFANMIVNGVPGQSIVALQTVQPPLVGTVPAPALTSGERVIITMMSTEGWLQWLPVSGAGNLLVWELR